MSDTHGYWDDRYLRFFADCDEIWHAGDIGGNRVYERLCAAKPVRAVFGNADGNPLRQQLQSALLFDLEGVRVYMTHIGGYPGRYASAAIRQLLRQQHVKLFISGHSHILKVGMDPELNLLHINPGAAGRQGFHLVRTLTRFTLDQGEIKDFELMEIPLQEDHTGASVNGSD